MVWTLTVDDELELLRDDHDQAVRRLETMYRAEREQRICGDADFASALRRQRDKVTRLARELKVAEEADA